MGLTTRTFFHPQSLKMIASDPWAAQSLAASPEPRHRLAPLSPKCWHRDYDVRQRLDCDSKLCESCDELLQEFCAQRVYVFFWARAITWLDPGMKDCRKRGVRDGE